MKLLPRFTALLPLLLTACSHGAVSLTPFPTEHVSHSHQLSERVSVNETQPPSSLLSPLSIEPIALEPVNQEIISQQIELRKLSEQTIKRSKAIELPQAERNKIKQLEARLLSQIKTEDQNQTKLNPDFKTLSLEGGEDVDIELFLYHPTYGKRAKSWGIDTAKEFLLAGKSPTRRWLLRLKLEGLFAPRGFKYQVLFWVEQADLLRISGIDREMAWLLAANGITSVPDLARRTNNLEQVALLTSLKLMAFQNGFNQPSENDLEDWVNEAQTLEPIIY